MADEVTPYIGVNFCNLRKALYLIFFGINGAETFDSENYKYIIPMQASWENPLNETDAKDTYVQFWIERDEGLNIDSFDESYESDGSFGANIQKRVSSILLRFSGKQAEAWSKVFNHVTKRKDVQEIFSGVCNAEKLVYTSPILPLRVNYFGKKTSIAFDVRFKLYYDEAISTGWKPLEGIKFTIQGDLSVEG